MNFFTHSIDEIYACIQQQKPCWKRTDAEYHMIHDKAGKLGVVLLLHTKERMGQDLSPLPIHSQDPESVTACKQAMEALQKEFIGRLCGQQKEQYLVLEESQSKIEWQLYKEAYAHGMVNGMIQLANIAPLVFRHE